MTGPESGWAVWPSGKAWVLLHTTDGFRHVDNRTPPGVPTDGGLVVRSSGTGAAVAVGPVERLLRSPLLTASGHRRVGADELPAGVVGSRSAVALPARGDRADRGSRRHAARPDRRRVAERASTPVRCRALAGLALDGVTWAGDSVGWLTGHGRPAGCSPSRPPTAGPPGRRSGTGRGAVAALAPCGGERPGRCRCSTRPAASVLRTRDARRAPGSRGSLLPAPRASPSGVAGARLSGWSPAPAHGERGLRVVRRGRHLDGRGAGPAGLTDLSPTGGGTGFAATGGGHPPLWRVTGDGAPLHPDRPPGLGGGPRRAGWRGD